MTSYFQHISHLVSCCLNCGSFWTEPSALCWTCGVRLKARYKSSLGFEVQKLRTHTLFLWMPKQSDGLSRLLLHIKKRNSYSLWQIYANELAREFMLNTFSSEKDRDIYIVPAPPRKQGARDHAYLWALALAAATGGQVLPCLRRSSQGEKEQKKRSLFERRSIHFEIDENSTSWPQNWKESTWIFADDIVTTGATAAAAFSALGSPTHFYILALAYRRLSCEDVKNLL